MGSPRAGALSPAQAKALRVIDLEGAATVGFSTSHRAHTVANAPARALVKLGLCQTYQSGRYGETYIMRKR